MGEVSRLKILLLLERMLVRVVIVERILEKGMGVIVEGRVGVVVEGRMGVVVEGSVGVVVGGCVCVVVGKGYITVKRYVTVNVSGCLLGVCLRIVE